MCFTRGVTKALLAISTAGLLLFGSPARAAPQPPDTKEARTEDGTPYLVLPFHNRSRSAGLSWMSTALAVTLAEKLEAHQRLRPAYGDRVLRGLEPLAPEADAAAQATTGQRAREAGARLLLTGTFDRVDWRYVVGLRLYEVQPDGSLRETAQAETRSATATAGVAAIFELLDQSMLSVLGKAGLPIDATERVALLRRPTRDAYAFTLYGRALLAYAQVQQDGEASRAELEKIEKTLRRVCFIDPKFAEAHRALGMVLLEMGEVGKATGQYAHALELKSDYFAAMLGLGRLYHQAGNRLRSQEVLERALLARPWSQDARLELGKVLWEGGHLVEAQTELTRVVAARPDDLPARRALAMVHAARGQIEELAAELLRVTQLAPEDTDVRLDLGAAYVRLQQTDKAIAVYEDVLQRRPKGAGQVPPLRMLAEQYRKRGEAERAVPLYQRWMRLQAEDPRPYFALAATYLELGQDARAERVLSDAQQFRRYLGEAWTDLGVVALRKHDLVRANWYLSRAVVRAPMRPRAHYNFALLLDRMNQPDKALAELRAAAELDPQDAEISFALGAVLAKLGRLDEAGRAFAETVQLRPDHEDARHNLRLLAPR